MKNALLFFVLTAGVNSSALLFSYEPWLSESWASLGLEYGNFFESHSERENTIYSYTGSLGINFGGYRFFNGNSIGIFIDGLVAFPVTGFSETNGVITRNDFGNDLFRLQVGMVIGPAFRFAWHEKIDFRFGVGVCFLLTSASYTEYIQGIGDAAYSKSTWNLGIGGDAGLKFNITDTVFLNAGSIFTFDFLGHISVDTPYGSSSGWAKDFFMISIRPYIAIGMILHWE